MEEPCAPATAPTELLNRLHAGFGRGLIVIEAPAGAGKSSLVAAFLSELDCDVRYVVIDPLCTCPEVLAERILLTLEPGRTDSRAFSKLADLKWQIASSLGDRHVARPLLLVLDNVEHLAGHADAMAVVEAVHDALPSYVNMIIAGRSVQSEKLESRAATRGCLWLTREDLGQGTANLSQRRPLRLIVRSAGGQPQATALQLGQKPDIPGRLQLVLQLIGLMPDVTMRCLENAFGIELATSVSAFLEKNPGLCDQGLSEGGKRLRHPIRVGDGNLDGPTSSDVEPVTAACSYLLNSGLPYHAAEMAIRMHSARAQSLVLAELGPEALRDGSFGVLRRLIGESEPGVRADLTKGLGAAIRARVEAAAGDPQAALRLIDSLWQHGQLSHEARIHTLIAETVAGMLSAELPRAQQAAELLEEAARGEASAIRFDALMSAGDYHLFIRSDTAKATALYQLGLQFAEQLEHPVLLALAEGKLGDLAYTTGDIPAAISTIEKAVARWRELGSTSRLCLPLNNLGMAHTAAGNILAAARSFRDAAQSARSASLDVREACSLASLAELELGFGSTGNARAHLDRALALCSRSVSDERLRALVLADLAICDLNDRLADAAHTMATRSVLLAETSAGPIDRAICRSILARVQFAMGLHGPAESSLLDSVAVFEAAGAQGELVGAHLHLAVFAHACGSVRRSKQHLKTVLRLAKHGSHKGTVLAVLRQERGFAAWVRERGELSDYLDNDDWQKIEFSALHEAEHTKPKHREILYHRATGTVRVREDSRIETLGMPPPIRALFELFLDHRDGVSAPDVRRFLNPVDPENRGNSAMHTAVFRLESTLFDGAVVREGEALRLDPQTIIKVA